MYNRISKIGVTRTTYTRSTASAAAARLVDWQVAIKCGMCCTRALTAQTINYPFKVALTLNWHTQRRPM